MIAKRATPPDATGQIPPPPALDTPAGGAMSGIEAGLRADQMESLGWLRRYGMSVAERIDRHAQGLLLERERSAFKECDVALAFSRVSRAVRQIILLEQETAGLRDMRLRRAAPDAARAAPLRDPDAPPASAVDRPERLDRDEADDGDDYDDDDTMPGPADHVVARVRAEFARAPGATLTESRLATTRPNGQARIADPLPEEPRRAFLMAPGAQPLPGAPDWVRGHDPP